MRTATVAERCLCRHCDRLSSRECAPAYVFWRTLKKFREAGAKRTKHSRPSAHSDPNQALFMHQRCMPLLTRWRSFDATKNPFMITSSNDYAIHIITNSCERSFGGSFSGSRRQYGKCSALVSGGSRENVCPKYYFYQLSSILINFLRRGCHVANSVATTRVFLAFLASRETSRGTFLTSSGTLRGGILVKTQKKTEKNSDP